MTRPAVPGPVLDAVLALPREAGTTEAAEARQLLTGELERLGYEVDSLRFAFSTRALAGFPIFGAGLGWLAVLEVPLLLIPGVTSWAAALVWLIGIMSLVAVAAGVSLGWGPRGTPREDATLIARRPGADVRRWIVAHTDTKAQGHSMAGRLVAVWISIVAVVVVTGMTVARLGGPLPVPAVAGAAGLLLAAGVLAGRGRLRGQSLGARDNGSGLVAALTAAEVSADPATGILLTGAEEFGLVGARILAAQRPELVRGREFINIDTVDERGSLYLVSHDAAGHRLAERLEPVLGIPGAPVHHRRLPLGIFVDSYPLARAGGTAVTIGRLDWSTLRLLHTAGDTREGLSFETAIRVGRLGGGWTG